MALGDLAFEETGKFAGIRALPDGKVEATYQGTGKLFGADYSSIYTGVATPHGGTNAFPKSVNTRTDMAILVAVRAVATRMDCNPPNPIV
jgi:hypothetical protein